jgi:hypothetical protein
MDGCKFCNAMGPWVNGKYNRQSKQWTVGKYLPDGLKFLAIHQKNWTDEVLQADPSKIPYNNFITSGKLLVALMCELGMSNRTLYRKYPTTPGERETLMTNYIRHNEGKFQCYECKIKQPMISKCHLAKCKKRCYYVLCRSCFLKRITTEDISDSRKKNNGVLKCPLCQTTSRCYYSVVHYPVSAATTKQLGLVVENITSDNED